MMIEEVGFANIRNDSETRKVFEHPCTLIRLAYLLMGIQKESDKKRRRKKTDKPFIASYMDV